MYLESLNYKYCFRGKKNFYKHHLDEKIKDGMFHIPLDDTWIKRFKIEEVKEIIRLAETIQDLFENPGDYSYERIKTQIMDFEEDIINDYGLMEGDKQIVLQTTSVFRYSTAQWEEALPGFSAEIVPTGWTLNGKKLKWWQWLVVGIADAAGGALGTAIGGPLGTAGGAVLASSGAAGIFVATN